MFIFRIHKPKNIKPLRLTKPEKTSPWNFWKLVPALNLQQKYQCTRLMWYDHCFRILFITRLWQLILSILAPLFFFWDQIHMLYSLLLLLVQLAGYECSEKRLGIFTSVASWLVPRNADVAQSARYSFFYQKHLSFTHNLFL